MLNAREPKIVNGPQILDKYVGESEANVRKLFADAEEEEKRVSCCRDCKLKLEADKVRKGLPALISLLVPEQQGSRVQFCFMLHLAWCKSRE